MGGDDHGCEICFNCGSLFQERFSERIGIASFMHAVSLHYAIFEMKVDMQICLAIYNISLRQCQKRSAYLIKSGLKTVNTVVSWKKMQINTETQCCSVCSKTFDISNMGQSTRTVADLA